MDYYPATFGFSNTLNVAGLEIKTAMLRFSQQIRQYQMDCINSELADHEASKKQQKLPRDIAHSQKSQLELVGNQYAKFVNYWTGLNQVMLHETAQMAMAMRKCGVNTAQKLLAQTGASIPTTPEHVHSAMDAGMGYIMANFEASQRYALENAHAVLDSADEQAVSSTGKYSKPSGHLKQNSRRGANGAAA
jgi:hypothetical protein